MQGVEERRSDVATGYAELPPGLARPLTSDDISNIFHKPPGWFGRDRVRKRLYAKGFPRPFERGLWSQAAVSDWLANPAPSGRRRSTGTRRNGYADVAVVG